MEFFENRIFFVGKKKTLIIKKKRSDLEVI